MSFYAYAHVRPGADAAGVFYVGKGKKRRAYDFMRRNPHHQRTIDKYGAENIEVGIVHCSDEATAFDLEIGLIKCLRRMGVKLTNLTDGGEGVTGVRHSEESRLQMSKTRKGRSHSENTKAKMSIIREGEKNSFYGKRHSEETKRKISEAKKANPNRYWAGKTRSEEDRKKMSIAHKGRKHPPVSDETKLKISIANKGRKNPPASDETRRRLSVAIKESWRKRKQIASGDNT
jgi:hypothetical protein